MIIVAKHGQKFPDRFRENRDGNLRNSTIKFWWDRNNEISDLQFRYSSSTVCRMGAERSPESFPIFENRFISSTGEFVYGFEHIFGTLAPLCAGCALNGV